MTKELKKQLYIYLGELDYIVENSYDYFDKIILRKTKRSNTFIVKR